MVRAPMYRIALFALALCSSAEAQISLWQIGGAGLAWDGSDTTRIVMDINAERIRPVYFADGDNMFLSVAGWSELIVPRELGYIDGHQPRLWYMDGTNVNQTSYFDSPLYVDGLRSTYNTARDGWWTIDIGVPVPATRFGFATPTEGIRSDGVPLNQDPVPAFEVSIAAETSDIFAQKGYRRLNTLIADVPVNFDPEVEIDFPQQYVRFVRYQRKASALDEQRTTDSNTVRGTIAEFVLTGRGVPKRAIYRSKILDLGTEVNFGRLAWTVRTMRMVGEEAVAVPDAEAWVEVEVRAGRDGDPNIYREYTDSGREFAVTRARYENDLRLPETEGFCKSTASPASALPLATTARIGLFGPVPLQNLALGSTCATVRICNSKSRCKAGLLATGWSSIRCGLKPRRRWPIGSWERSLAQPTCSRPRVLSKLT